MRSIAFIKPFLIATALMAIGACAAGSAHDDRQVDAPDGGVFTMQPGQQVSLADRSRLRYVRLLSDSRCQPDVQCIWAGDAELAFEWTSAGGATQSFSLHTGKDPREQALGSRRLALVSVGRGPSPSAQLRIDTPPSP